MISKISNFSIINLTNFDKKFQDEIDQDGVRVSNDKKPREKFLQIFDKNKICLELGVHKGRHALQMYEILEPSKLYLIDIEDRRSKEDNLGLDFLITRDNVSYILKDSKICHDMFDDKYFDFIYIDGNHSYDGVLSDLTNWVPKVKSGGYVTGHDFKLPSSENGGFSYNDNGLVIPSDSNGVVQAVVNYLNSNEILNLALYWEGDIYGKKAKSARIHRKKKIGFEFCIEI